MEDINAIAKELGISTMEAGKLIKEVKTPYKMRVIVAMHDHMKETANLSECQMTVTDMYRTGGFKESIRQRKIINKNKVK